MRHRTCLLVVFCVALALGCVSPALANEEVTIEGGTFVAEGTSALEDTAVVCGASVDEGDATKGSATMEGASAVMVKLEPGAVRQEVTIPIDGETGAIGVIDEGPVRSVRHIQTLLRTGDASTFALSFMLAFASAALACFLFLERRDISPIHSIGMQGSVWEGCRAEEDNSDVR